MLCQIVNDKKTDKKYYGAKLIFRSFATFFGLTIFRSGAKQTSLIYYPCQFQAKMQELTLQTSQLAQAHRSQLYYKLPQSNVLQSESTYHALPFVSNPPCALLFIIYHAQNIMSHSVSVHICFGKKKISLPIFAITYIYTTQMCSL